MHSTKKIHYSLAGASFLLAFIVYYITMQPSVSFWDCGEFAAAASSLQVPHPPGAPLWTLLGRLLMLVPVQSDPVGRYNFFSVIFSSLTVMFLYLTGVRLIELWKGKPNSTREMLMTFGGAFVGAATYIFTDSFWFNALECEVYAFTMFFISLLLWMALVWYDKANEEGSEKYLLLMSYVFGLGLSAHQIIVLTIFTIFMLIYYRRDPNPTLKSWIVSAAVSLLGFVIVYKLILTKLFGWLGSIPLLTVMVLVAIVAGIYLTRREKQPLYNIGLWAVLLIILGYSSYSMVLIRSAQHTPMNLDAPSNFTAMKHYLERDQYGDRGFWPRRSLDEFGQKTGPTWDATKYSSDLDFMWKYQIDHLSNRYMIWNFVGRKDDRQDAGTDWTKTWGLPLFLGLFGMYWHFKRDPKRALSIFLMFLTLGIVSALFQNTQDPTERERDYFYVGSYYIFALWVGIGATGVMEMLSARKSAASEEDDEKEESKRSAGPRIATATEDSASDRKIAIVFACCLIAAPLNLCVGLFGLASGQSFAQSSKWAEYSRKGNYVPFDCAYNILQSCDKDAILFTSGDNDTFPLWCLQDVYGIRRDVRIVLLNFANFGWYIDQLKNAEPWGAKKVAMIDPNFSDENLKKMITSDDPSALTAKKEPAHLVTIPLSAEVVRQITGDSTQQGVMMSWKYLGSYDAGNDFMYTTSDQVVFDIIRSNINSRPIYFSVTVPENKRIGLDQNLAAEGLAWRVTPVVASKDNSGFGGGVNEARLRTYLFSSPNNPTQESAQQQPARASIIRTFSDPSAGIGYIDKSFAFNYNMAFMRYANWAIEHDELADAAKAMETMERRLPPAQTNSDIYPADMIADLYQQVGNQAKMNEYAAIAIQQFKKEPGGTPAVWLQRQYRLANLYLLIGDYDNAANIYRDLPQRTNDPGVAAQMKVHLREIDGRKLEDKGDKAGALAIYEDLLKNKTMSDEDIPLDFKPLLRHRNALRKQLGVAQVPPATTVASETLGK